MKIDLPTWAEINERAEQLERTDRTIAQGVLSGDKLNPVEQFIYDYEPNEPEEADEWRAALKSMLENAWMVEAV